MESLIPGCAETRSCEVKMTSAFGVRDSEISTSRNLCEWRPSKHCPLLALSSPTAHGSMHFVARKKEGFSSKALPRETDRIEEAVVDHLTCWVQMKDDRVDSDSLGQALSPLNRFSVRDNSATSRKNNSGRE
jgi:hypothetical protein